MADPSLPNSNSPQGRPHWQCGTRAILGDLSWGSSLPIHFKAIVLPWCQGRERHYNYEGPKIPVPRVLPTRGINLGCHLWQQGAFGTQSILTYSGSMLHRNQLHPAMTLCHRSPFGITQICGPGCHVCWEHCVISNTQPSPQGPGHNIPSWAEVPTCADFQATAHSSWASDPGPKSVAGFPNEVVMSEGMAAL